MLLLSLSSLYYAAQPHVILPLKIGHGGGQAESTQEDERERDERLRKIERDEDFSRYLLSIFIIEPLAILQNYIIVPLYFSNSIQYDSSRESNNIAKI